MRLASKFDGARAARSSVWPRSFKANSRAVDPHRLNVSAPTDERELSVSTPSFVRVARRFGSIGTAICAATVMLSVALEGSGSARAEPAATARSAASSSDLPFASFIAEASQRFSIPVSWIRAVMQIESGGRAHAASPKGAMGLMQIMPKTYAELRARYRLGSNPYDPRDNILAGAAYLREMHDRYGSTGFLAAYNAGPDRYDEHLATGRPLPIETQDYVAMLTPMIGGGPPESGSTAPFDLVAWLRSTLFAPHENTALVAVHEPVNPSSDRPPTERHVVDLSALAPHSDGLFVRVADRTQSQ
jgi:soluble lytic murein transglycosylase-like protein